MRELIAKGEWPQDEYYLRASYQTAGRGQTGNGWESAPDKNLLCSILVKTQKIKEISPFYLNVAVSVAIHKVIESYIVEQSELTIKWPNDIYWQDKKMAGILVETAIIGGELKYAIAGIGLNVNQTEFISDAPNPISLKQITGREYEPDELMQQLYAELQKELSDTSLQTSVWEYYRAHLYRREGFWPFVEREVNTRPTMNASASAKGQFMARIKDVLPSGEIVLEDRKEKTRTYHFKQVRYVI